MSQHCDFYFLITKRQQLIFSALNNLGKDRNKIAPPCLNYFNIFNCYYALKFQKSYLTYQFSFHSQTYSKVARNNGTDY